VDGKPVGSSLIGQSFTDSNGNPLPQYFQSRPSMAGDGYDPMGTSASNLGPESIIDSPDKPSLLTLVCSRSAAVGELEGVDGTRPFCTGDGVGAVLSVIGPRDARGNVVHPTRVVSVNEPCDTTPSPFLTTYEGVRVECAEAGEDYSIGQIVPIRGSAPADPQVPADAVTASGSGLDPHISPAYAELQVNRVAKARGVTPQQVRQAVADNTDGRWLGFVGEPRVNVLALNIELDEKYPGG
jgi:K+-transporting ATPase ATPase C chain